MYHRLWPPQSNGIIPDELLYRYFGQFITPVPEGFWPRDDLDRMANSFDSLPTRENLHEFNINQTISQSRLRQISDQIRTTTTAYHRLRGQLFYRTDGSLT